MRPRTGVFCSQSRREHLDVLGERGHARAECDRHSGVRMSEEGRSFLSERTEPVGLLSQCPRFNCVSRSLSCRSRISL